jgi:FkbM family methyltransferase
MITKKNIIHFNDVELTLIDLESSETIGHLEREIIGHDEYKIKNIELNDGDVVVDIGANVGIVSIYLAKRFPNAIIYAYEAHPNTYENLIKNIKINNVKNIFAHNLAVYSKDNETLDITLDIINTGSSSCFKNGEGQITETIPTISLDTIITNNNISNIRYLKIDCEGAEFDILEGSKLIHEIEVQDIGIEIHSFMKSHGKDVESLKELVKKISIKSPKIKIYGK